MKHEINYLYSADFGSVRSVTMEDGTRLYCGKDVAKALGFCDPGHAVRRVCLGGVIFNASSNGGSQPTRFIDQEDVTRMARRSTHPLAKLFTEWVAGASPSEDEDCSDEEEGECPVLEVHFHETGQMAANEDPDCLEPVVKAIHKHCSETGTPMHCIFIPVR